MVLCALAMSTGSTLGQFVPNDRIVSDPAATLVDPEFDQLDNYMVLQEVEGNLWLAKIDPVTGDIHPPDGRGKLLDTIVANPSESGNGPEFGYGGGEPYVVYTRRLLTTMGLGVAKQDVSGVSRHGVDLGQPQVAHKPPRAS